MKNIWWIEINNWIYFKYIKNKFNITHTPPLFMFLNFKMI